MPELTEAAIRNILTLAVGLGALIAAFKGFFASKVSAAPAPSATNEMLAGLVRSVDQKLEIGVREQARNDGDVMRRFDRVDSKMDDMWQELHAIRARLEIR